MTALHTLISSLPDSRRLLLAVVALGMFSGCGSSEVSDPKALDTQIEEQWMAGREKVDAIEFLEKNGQYENMELPEESQVDQFYVLPLLKKVRDELSLKPVAVLLDSERALAVLVPIPTASAPRNRLRDFVRDADEGFAGLLLDNWGEKWLSLDFLSEREVEVFKNSGTLEALQKELDFQRSRRD